MCVCATLGGHYSLELQTHVVLFEIIVIVSSEKVSNNLLLPTSACAMNLEEIPYFLLIELLFVKFRQVGTSLLQLLI